MVTKIFCMFFFLVQFIKLSYFIKFVKFTPCGILAFSYLFINVIM